MFIFIVNSKRNLRLLQAWTAEKHIFVDPSIGIAALGLSPAYFYNDLDLFGHVFENMVLRDLLVYAAYQAEEGWNRWRVISAEGGTRIYETDFDREKPAKKVA